MGILKSGWLKWSMLLFVGLMFIGIFVCNYFQANAEVNETNNQPKNSLNKQIGIQEQSLLPEQITIDLKPEEEVIHKNQKGGEKSENKQIPEDPEPISIPSPENTETTAPPLEKEVTQPPTISKQTIYLTFDDGPQLFSDEIIALLEQYNFKATFFMLEGNIKKYPDAVKLMVDTGQSIGLHGVTHDRSQFYASASSVITELDQTRLTLRDITGIDSFLMRTPYGSKQYMTDEYREAVFDNGYLMWDWTIDSMDWYYKDDRLVDSVLEQIATKENRNEPLVILLHEKKETLEQLPALLDYLYQQNFESKAIDSMMIPIHF